MFPFKIYKKTLRTKYPKTYKTLKIMSVHRYTDESEGFFGSPEDPYWVYALRIGDTDITLEYCSSLYCVVIDKYGDNPEILFEGSAK